MLIKGSSAIQVIKTICWTQGGILLKLQFQNEFTSTNFVVWIAQGVLLTTVKFMKDSKYKALKKKMPDLVLLTTKHKYENTYWQKKAFSTQEEYHYLVFKKTSQNKLSILPTLECEGNKPSDSHSTIPGRNAVNNNKKHSWLKSSEQVLTKRLIVPNIW